MSDAAMSDAAMSDSAKPLVHIDIVSDVMCPWCYIGKRRLEKALAMVKDEVDVAIRWLPFQLDATLPPQGKDRRQYLEDKFGGPERADQIYAQIKSAGDGEGIAFEFDAIKVSPNTFDAHRLIAMVMAQTPPRQNAVVDALFRAFFIDGVNIGDRDNLADIAASVGFDREEVYAALMSDEASEETQNMLASVGAAGISGVPFFILDQKFAISGAQPPDAFQKAIRQAAAHNGA